MAVITGDENDNVLNGTAGDDQILGQGGADSLFGLAGDDILTGGAGNDIIDGGAGIDTYDLSDRFQGFNVNLTNGQSTSGFGEIFEADTISNITNVFGSSGDDVIIGNGEGNTLQGLGGNDTVSGFGGNDILLGGDGADSIFGGDGDDLLLADQGDDLIDGGAGFDFLTYFSLTNQVIVNLNVNSSVQSTDGSGTDTLVGVESIAGTAADDTFTVGPGFVGSDGTAFASIRGGGGNDSINGNGETRIDYIEARSGVRVDITAGTAQGILGNSGVGQDTFNGVAQVRGSNFDDILFGSDASSFESFRGQAGNDFIDGRGGSNDRADYQSSPTAVNVDLASRVGQDGFGTLDFLFNIEDVRGSSFNDVIAGDAGNNVFRGLGGDDALNGRGGIDTADYRSDANEAIIVNLGSVATVEGGLSVGIDSLTGIERIFGSKFSDTFKAEAGFSNGTEDPDQPARQLFNIFRGGAGDDAIDGNGVTRVEYIDAEAAVRVDLGTGEAGSLDVELDDANIGLDQLNVQTVFEVRGSRFDDFLIGSNINPFAGFESFIGEAGDDAINGGLGVDRVSYSTSTDVNGVFVNLQIGTASDGFGGTDTLVSIEDIKGSNFGDVLVGSTGNNVFEGLRGDDDIRGGEGIDTVLYKDSSERVVVDLRAGNADKGADGSDDLQSIENVTATAFNDIVVGSTESNVLTGLGGNDRLIGLSENDILNGNSGNDVLFGNSGDDVLVGGAGKDRLIGGFGVDAMTGGDGNDTYFVDSSDDTILELAGEGVDTVIIAPGTNVTLFANVEIYILDFGPGQNGTLAGGATAETLIGGSGDDILVGNGGDDILLGGAGADRLFGRAGEDLLKGGTGQDLLDGGDGNDVIVGGAGNDLFIEAESGKELAGLQGGAGLDRLNGQSGNDLIEGGAGGDRIIGGSGNDQLAGGRLDVSGGDGDGDRFLFSSGSGLDTIVDFENDVDLIDFRGLNLETGRFPSFAAVQLALSESDGNTTITISGTDAITLLGVTNAQLDASDFIFKDLVLFDG